jgi:hypothetical protein
MTSTADIIIHTPTAGVEIKIDFPKNQNMYKRKFIEDV